MGTCESPLGVCGELDGSVSTDHHEWVLETHSIGSNPINTQSSYSSVPPEAPVYSYVPDTVELFAVEHDKSSSDPLALEVSHVALWKMVHVYLRRTFILAKWRRSLLILV